MRNLKSLNVDEIAKTLQFSASGARTIADQLDQIWTQFVYDADLEIVRRRVDSQIEHTQSIASALRGARVRLKREAARERRKAKKAPKGPEVLGTAVIDNNTKTVTYEPKTPILP